MSRSLAIGIADPDDLETAEEVPAIPVQKNFKMMRESVMGQDLSP